MKTNTSQFSRNTLVSLLTLATSLSLCGAPRFTVTDIGTLGGPTSACLFINNSGHVIGRADTASGETHAFLWRNGSITDLGTLPGGTYSEGNFVNERGEVAGGATLPNGDFHAVVWRQGVITDLGTLPGGNFSVAILMNSRGDIVGFGSSANGDRGILWRNGQIIDLGILDGGTFSSAILISESGRIAAFGDNANGDMLTYVLKGGEVSAFLPPLAGYDNSFLGGINSSGNIVVGESATADESHTRATLWTGGQVIDLGTLGGARSLALWISDKGQVTGESETTPNVFNAFLWENGHMADLNDLIPGGSGWHLEIGWAVNSKEQICGNGTNPDGLARGWVLTPRTSKN